MKIIIRQEKTEDYKQVFNLVEKAFKDQPYSDGDEQLLVERLRKSDSFIPELSLVAEIDKNIVGYILLTKLKIIDGEKEYATLSLAPVAVLPGCQKMGVGKKLILEAHKRAVDLGHESVILVGHENYYPKFGYKLAKSFNLTFPFEAPDINCMVIELKENALHGIKGMVTYPKEFF